MAGLVIGLGQSTLTAAVAVGFTLTSADRHGYYVGSPSGTLVDFWQEGVTTGIVGSDVPASTYPITITTYGGSSITPVTQVAFCVELEEGITFGSSYTHDVTTLSAVAPSASGLGKGAGISSSGIGSYKADLVQILFDQYYTSSGGANPAAWSDINAAAFQLSLWKLTHEDPQSGSPLANTSLYLGTGPDTVKAHFGYYKGAEETGDPYVTAQSWVDAVIATYNAGPHTPVLSLMPLTNEAPFAGFQDLITVTLVPEPQEWALGCGLGLFALVGVRRWRRSRGAA